MSINTETDGQSYVNIIEIHTDGWTHGAWHVEQRAGQRTHGWILTRKSYNPPGKLPRNWIMDIGPLHDWWNS